MNLHPAPREAEGGHPKSLPNTQISITHCSHKNKNVKSGMRNARAMRLPSADCAARSGTANGQAPKAKRQAYKYNYKIKIPRGRILTFRLQFTL